MRFAIAVVLILLPLPVEAGELRVTVDGIRSSHGTILIGLHDSLESFKPAPEFAAVALRANAAMKSAVVFSNLDPGRYAIIVFHDENGNGKLDKNFMGVTIEPYGFSKDAEGFLACQAFDDAAMRLGGSDRVVRLVLIYHGTSKKTEFRDKALPGSLIVALLIIKLKPM